MEKRKGLKIYYSVAPSLLLLAVPYANVLELKICSWRINECKSVLTPDEFVEVCRKVAERMKAKGSTKTALQA